MSQHARDFKAALDGLDDAMRKQRAAARKPSYQDPIAATSGDSLGGDWAPQARPAANAEVPQAKPATNADLSWEEYEAVWKEAMPNLEPHNAGDIDQPGSEAYNRFGLGNVNSATAKRAREGKRATPPDTAPARTSIPMTDEPFGGWD